AALAAAPAAHPRPAPGRLSLVRGGNGKARRPCRSAGSCRRCASVPTLYVRIDRPPQGRDHAHHGMLWYVAYNQRYWPSAESERGLVALPLFHKNALRGTVKPMLYAGGSFVLMPAYEPRGYLDALAKYKCTYSRGVAAVFTMFLQHRDYLRTLDLSALRHMTIGSAVVMPELVDAVERALPHVKVSESYGLTEGGSPLRAPIDGRAVPRGSPGVAAPEIELNLIDAAGNDADEGELLIRCPYVCRGYYNEPEI